MFTTPLDVRFLGDGKYELLSDLIYKWGDIYITSHKGFICNFANIPSHLYEEIGCPCDFAYAGTLHDNLYASMLFDRKTCDKIFHSALLSRGIPKIKSKAMYLAVRIAGEAYYGKGSLADSREFISVKVD